MAARGLVTEFRAQAKCPICLQYFENPVTIDCGHNFCQACIAQCWGESNSTASCPQCGETVQKRNFKPNQPLANITEIIKKYQEGERAEGDKQICERHREPLKLFCKDDEAPICVVCDRSKRHQNHSVLPVEEASQEFKEKIQDQLLSLEKERERLKEQKITEEQGSQKCLTQLEVEKQKILTTFEQMRNFLEEKEHLLLAQITDLEKEIKRKQEENLTRLCEEIPRLSKLLTEMEEKCQQAESQFLQNIGSTVRRYGSFSFTFREKKGFIYRPPVLPLSPPLCPTVSVTLDPDTANPHLILSEDLKSVRWAGKEQDLPKTPERFDKERCVLGRERISSGRHWWEVEVVEEEEEGALWAVGATRESVKRKGYFSLNPSEGIWAVGKPFFYSISLRQLAAFTSPKRTPLDLRPEPRKILVCLDYEEGSVTFFDAETDHLIFTFSSAVFSGEKICPYFWVGKGVTLKC
ncbi:PREDICTED: zinc finger protein RFP-like [Gekko japonicus]|uniref:Zinc finger protein RFP-like n=1 Tax=Gekko japonicus TaxID=146911 RepID=A0ABM1KZK0_GEKJA|nr:PREDICTED: zinc finger protein RFP-like [Gekko japonicus]